MATAVETIKTLMSTLKKYSTDESYVGVIALDDAIRTATTFTDTNDAIDKLTKALGDTETYPDTNTRLQKATGMVIGAEKDYTVDTGAISGANAGGSVVKNAQDIVPENGDLSTATLPEVGSTVPITYTGNDGKSFTFYVKYPDSFSTVVQGFDEKDRTNGELKIIDSRYYVDLNTLDENYSHERTSTNEDGTTKVVASPTVAQMKESIQTILKGLNTYWLREGAKLDYDSLGFALDGQTIEIKFIAGGDTFDGSAAITFSHRNDYQPSNHIILAIDLFNYGNISPTDPNGSTENNGGEASIYLDRVLAHEMVHAVMQSNGTLKNGMPQFFTEGVADLVQGDDDYNSEQRKFMIELANNTDTLQESLSMLPGTGSSYAYPAGNMLLRFIAQHSLDTTAMIGDSAQQQTFSYSTGSGVVTGYKEGDFINYNLTDGAALRYVGATAMGDFVFTEFTQNFEKENTFVIRDVRDKLVTLNTSYGTEYAYLSSSAGKIDGRNFNNGENYQVIVGANYLNNSLHAGNNGSQLWGGYRGNDELFGGAGEDTFMYDFDGGNDKIFNAESQDKVIIFDTSLDQISAAQITDEGSYLVFTDGMSLSISGKPETFILENDETYTYYAANYETKSWTPQN
ncbi:MAG: hypothetical protein IJT06_04240 [Selenomonadaceae bacterium]|nr:hypothetical protein [Selenomonadaceae bacterium]